MQLISLRMRRLWMWLEGMQIDNNVYELTKCRSSKCHRKSSSADLRLESSTKISSVILRPAERCRGHSEVSSSFLFSFVVSPFAYGVSLAWFWCWLVSSTYSYSSRLWNSAGSNTARSMATGRPRCRPRIMTKHTMSFDSGRKAPENE